MSRGRRPDGLSTNSTRKEKKGMNTNTPKIKSFLDQGLLVQHVLPLEDKTGHDVNGQIDGRSPHKDGMEKVFEIELEA